VELYLHFPDTSSWRGAQLEHRDNFNFTLPIRLICKCANHWHYSYTVIV